MGEWASLGFEVVPRDNAGVRILLLAPILLSTDPNPQLLGFNLDHVGSHGRTRVRGKIQTKQQLVPCFKLGLFIDLHFYAKREVLPDY